MASEERPSLKYALDPTSGSSPIQKFGPLLVLVVGLAVILGWAFGLVDPLQAEPALGALVAFVAALAGYFVRSQAA